MPISGHNNTLFLTSGSSDGVLPLLTNIGHFGELNQFPKTNYISE
jgi:hypothetical protein